MRSRDGPASDEYIFPYKMKEWAGGKVFQSRSSAGLALFFVSNGMWLRFRHFKWQSTAWHSRILSRFLLPIYRFRSGSDFCYPLVAVAFFHWQNWTPVHITHKHEKSNKAKQQADFLPPSRSFFIYCLCLHHEPPNLLQTWKVCQSQWPYLPHQHWARTTHSQEKHQQ